MCFIVRPVFTFVRVVMGVSYLTWQADMGGGLCQISLQVLHWKIISFSAEFFKASVPLHAACFFMCQKFAQGNTFFELLIWHEYFSHRLQMSCCEKKKPFLFFGLGSVFLNFCTVKEQLTQSQWLCVLDVIINIDNMSFICYAFVWKGLYSCRSEQKLK